MNHTASPQSSPGHSPAPLYQASAQPKHFVWVPQALLREAATTPLDIGLYALVGRLFLTTKGPVALSAPLVQNYDGKLSRGAVLRAFERLVNGGWLLQVVQRGKVARYTPTWGRQQGQPLAWDFALHALGRPRHRKTVQLDLRLFDLFIGRIVLNRRQVGMITRYLSAPLLGLHDIGCYGLCLGGLPTSTPALERWTLVYQGFAQPICANTAQILRRATQPPASSGEPALELTAAGKHHLGMTISPPDDPDAAELFFAPTNMIGNMIDNMIGNMIGNSALPETGFSLSESQKADVVSANDLAPWISIEKQTIPPPPDGGGNDLTKDDFPPEELPATPQPVTESYRLLRAAGVLPSQAHELALIERATVEAAIADAQRRRDLHSPAGWIVTLLRSVRDHQIVLTQRSAATALVDWAAERERLRSEGMAVDEIPLAAAPLPADEPNTAPSAPLPQRAAQHEALPPTPPAGDLLPSLCAHLCERLPPLIAERLGRRLGGARLIWQAPQRTWFLFTPSVAAREGLDRALLDDLRWGLRDLGYTETALTVIVRPTRP